MQAMIEDLRDYSVDEINIAFRKWRKERSKIPTPSDILKILTARKVEGRQGQKMFSDFNEDWPVYKQYLDDRGLLNTKLKP